MTSSKNVQELSESNFDAEVLASETPVLVDFWAPWCGPCRALGPIVEELADEYAGKLKVAKVNVDDAPHLAARYRVISIPMVLLFQGGKVVDGIIGAVPKAVLVQSLAKLLPAA